MSDQSTSPEETIDPIALFSPEIQLPVQGLTYLGQLTDEVKFCGHTFGLRTLRPQDRWAISLVLQPYRNTVYEVDAYQTLHVALALTSVDGNVDFCPPINKNIEDFARARLTWISDDQGWYPPLIDFLWQRYAQLETTAKAAIQELDRLLQRGLAATSTPSLDSLNELAPSPEETNSDIPVSTTSN